MLSNDASDKRVKIVFDLERDDDGYPPADFELLWAKPLGEDRYELDNSPFYVRGSSVGDVVLAYADAKGRLRYSRTTQPSLHTTLRVIVFQSSPDPRPLQERVEELRKRLKGLGCSSELSHLPGLIAVDVPPGASNDALIDLLADGESSGLWEYEEAAWRRG